MPKDDGKSVLEVIEGFTEVDPHDLEEFSKAMKEEVVPEIVKTVEERRLQAAKSRHWQLKC